LEEGNTTQIRGRRRRVFIVLAACILVGIGVVAIWPQEKEPEYNGKKLSEWMQPYDLRYSERRSIGRIDEIGQKLADDVVRHIGTNALPWMLKWIAYEPPAWKEALGWIVWKMPATPAAWAWALRCRFPGYDPESYHSQAIARTAFKILGPEAVPAAPALARIARKARSEDRRSSAMYALSCIGRGALPVLTQALEDKKLKHTAAHVIVNMSDAGVDITQAMPAILMIERETTEVAKTNSSLALWRAYAISAPTYWNPLMPTYPRCLISALTNCLQHTNIEIRVQAANALGRLDEAAQPAVPALKEALDYPAIALQEAALDALEKIAPEVLTNGAKGF
jgi:hypothetical protein